MCKIVCASLTPPRCNADFVLNVLRNAFGADVDLSFESSVARSRFRNGNSSGKYDALMQFFLKSIPRNTGGPWAAYGAFPPWLILQTAWAAALAAMPDKQRTEFQKKISALLQDLQKERQTPLAYLLARISESIRKEPFEAQLATLSMIACTWGTWECAFKDTSLAEKKMLDIRRLAALILPTSIDIQTTLPEAPIDLAEEEDCVNDADEAQALLAQARTLALHHRFREAGEKCETIVTDLTYAPDILRGEACCLLACCCQADLGGYKLPKAFQSVEELLLKANAFGYDHTAACDRRILQPPRQAADRRQGVCVCNARNDAASWLESTMPAGFEMRHSSTPASFVHCSETVRFVLLDEDLEKNVRDAIQILGTIQQASSWKHTEIFLRCEEEKVSPLLDTALSSLRASRRNGADCPVHLYLLDEAKYAAQELYARHPLFYPFTLDPDRKPSEPLHLVILSSAENTSLACWLVREAFWLLPVLPNASITLLSPYADQIRSRISAACPGLAKQITSGRDQTRQVELPFKNIPFPKMEFIQVDFESPKLNYELTELQKKEELKYYVVDAGSDLDTIALGTRIRENDIRHAVKKNKINLYAKNRSVIALRCVSPHTARLARELLVPKETPYGNQWFNNFGFITFSSLDELYSWDNLDGGIFQQLSKNLHLMYCGAAFASKDGCADEQALDSCYQSLYNQESSRASVIGLPYRLFCAGIVAPCWYIQDPDAYWGESQRRALADKLQSALHEDKSLLPRLAQYEHTRWVCYMISRGWLPFAYSEQAVQIIKAGAPKHMLQIARLHSCICCWEDLKTLQVQLDLAYRNEKSDGSHSKPDVRFEKYYDPEETFTYFQDLDNEGIQKTPQVLRTAWCPTHEKGEEPIR